MKSSSPGSSILSYGYIDPPIKLLVIIQSASFLSPSGDWLVRDPSRDKECIVDISPVTPLCWVLQFELPTKMATAVISPLFGIVKFFVQNICWHLLSRTDKLKHPVLYSVLGTFVNETKLIERKINGIAKTNLGASQIELDLGQKLLHDDSEETIDDLKQSAKRHFQEAEKNATQAMANHALGSELRVFAGKIRIWRRV